jgi:CRP-like cAMP-binding protein
VEDSRLLVLRKDAFLQLMKKDADLAVKLMWQLLHKLSQVIRSNNARVVADTVSMDSLVLEPEP